MNKDVMQAGSKPVRIPASPLARRLAAERGIALDALRGSGPHGRIVKRDIEAAPPPPPPPAAAALPPPRPPEGLTRIAEAISSRLSAPSGGGELTDERILSLYEPGTYEILAHDGMRRTIAERLTVAARTIPQFHLSVECRIDALLESRARLNKAAPAGGPRAYKLSVNDFLIKAWALALQNVPAANATWTGQGMLRHRHSDIGVAVAVDGGLFTPVVRNAEAKSLSEISNEMKELAERARKRRLLPHEYQGGSTSISNLGMYGIRTFDAIINPPHASILAVGSGEERVIVVNGQAEIATVMSCTLSCDHRVIDGALGAALLQEFKGYIEDPVRMLV